jgi:hypothetical protein
LLRSCISDYDEGEFVFCRTRLTLDNMHSVLVMSVSGAFRPISYLLATVPRRRLSRMVADIARQTPALNMVG